MARSRVAFARQLPKAHQKPPAGPARLFPAITPRTVVVFVAALVILLGPWPGYGRVFRTFFSGFGNAVLAVTGAGVAADPVFSASPPAGASIESAAWTVWLAATRGPAAAGPPMALDTRILGYTPLAMLAALVTASAIPWRRRAAVFATGASLLLTRLAIAIAMAVGRAFGSSGDRPGALTEIVWYVLVDVPAMTYVAPLVGWIVGLAVTERFRSKRVSSIRT